MKFSWKSTSFYHFYHWFSTLGPSDFHPRTSRELIYLRAWRRYIISSFSSLVFIFLLGSKFVLILYIHSRNMNSWGRRAKLHEYRLRSLHKVSCKKERAPRSPSITSAIFGAIKSKIPIASPIATLLNEWPKIVHVILGERGARSFLHETLWSEHKRYSWSLARRPQLFMFQECMYKISTNLEQSKKQSARKD